MKHAIALILAAILAATCGCAGSTRSAGGTDRYDHGLVILLSGAGGMMGETDRIRDGLQQGGVRRAIETFRWSRGGVLEDQTGVEANRRKARELARRIEGFKRSSPGAPVHLIGVSAGTGLVVWALEDLEPGMQATAAILVSSSLDTAYDLSKALKKTKDGIYSFNSMADTVLSLGVTWAGTVDRNGGLAGGLVGFGVPAGASEETKRLYKEKLHEISWWPGDVVLGHLGDHLGATNPAYVKEKIAPIVLGREPPKPPKKPPSEAVRARKTPTGAETSRTPTANRRTPAENAPARTPPKQKPSPHEKPAGKAKRALENDRDRFHNWRVRAEEEGSAQPALPDEAVFFSRPERLP